MASVAARTWFRAGIWCLRTGPRSRGGLGTKAHAATDALGNPVRLLFG